MTRQIRKLDRADARDIIIIALTYYNSQEEAGISIKAGIDATITKSLSSILSLPQIHCEHHADSSSPIVSAIKQAMLEPLMPWSKTLPAECYSKRRK